jgi:soluble lytic murein transglycosylase-like protein
MLTRSRKPVACSACFLLIAILICALIFPLVDGGRVDATKTYGRVASEFGAIESALPGIRETPLAVELEAARAGAMVFTMPSTEGPAQPKELKRPQYDPDILSYSGNIPPDREIKRYGSEGFSYSDEIPLSRELQEYTYGRSRLLGLEYEMVLAIMWRESQFKHDVVGSNSNGTRDSGLMQINDINRGWLKEKHGIENLLDPYQNIDAGTLILSDYFTKYDETRALLCYQYGEQGMLKKWEEGMRTNDLTVLVQSKRDEYRELAAV